MGRRIDHIAIKNGKLIAFLNIVNVSERRTPSRKKFLTHTIIRIFFSINCLVFGLRQLQRCTGVSNVATSNISLVLKQFHKRVWDRYQKLH